MAGRPLTKFKKVNELNHSAFGMMAEMLYAIPKPYLLEPDATDASCALWDEALNCVIRTAWALERLTERLAEKAGQQDRFSPLKEYFRKDDVGDETAPAVDCHSVEIVTKGDLS